MKFTRERLIKIIKEEAERVKKEANMPKNDDLADENQPFDLNKKVEFLQQSMKIISSAASEELKLDPKMEQFISDAAWLLDQVADALSFNELVKKHMDSRQGPQEE